MAYVADSPSYHNYTTSIRSCLLLVSISLCLPGKLSGLDPSGYTYSSACCANKRSHALLALLRLHAGSGSLVAQGKALQIAC